MLTLEGVVRSIFQAYDGQATATPVYNQSVDDGYGGIPATDGTDDGTLALRIAAIFIVLAAGLLGGLPPMFIKVFRDQDSLSAQTVRAVAAGVILALGLVHIIPEAVEQLSGLGGLQYPLGGTCVLAGVVVMVGLEHLAHSLHDRSNAGTHGGDCKGSGGGRNGKHTGKKGSQDSSSSGLTGLKEALVQQPAAADNPAAAGGDDTADVEAPVSACVAACLPAAVAVPGGAPECASGAGSRGVAAGGSGCGATATTVGRAEEGKTAGGWTAGCGTVRVAGSSPACPSAVGHIHVCVSLGSGPSILALAEAGAGRGDASSKEDSGSRAAGSSMRLKMLAYMFELGCVFHSVIIGISLGVLTDDSREVRALLIALTFHQWLEGLGLGSVIAQGGFRPLKGAMMVVLYAITCPAGIGIGIAVAETYDAETTRSRAVQGTFNAVSGGMLLYISLVQLVAEDLGRLLPSQRLTNWSRLCSLLGFVLGAGSMCVLAVWA